MNADSEISHTKKDFKDRSDQNLQELLEGKDKRNTQKATQGALSQFSQYLAAKKLPKLQDLTVDNLPEILYNFYPSVKPLKSNNYSVQTLKCLRSGLNRYFCKEKGFNITKDSQFVRANEMFQVVLVKSKKQGLGVKRSTPAISEIDLKRISEYFIHDHVNNPNPKKLQQQMIFYIIYFFCRRGRELVRDDPRHIYHDYSTRQRPICYAEYRRGRQKSRTWW